MLVSAISSFKAISDMHRAGMAVMQSNQNSMSTMRNSKGSETNFYALHQQDTKNELSLAKNKFTYQVASAWKKHCEAKMKKEMVQENKLNYKA